jgi:hypothetical protein
MANLQPLLELAGLRLSPNSRVLHTAIQGMESH